MQYCETCYWLCWVFGLNGGFIFPDIFSSDSSVTLFPTFFFLILHMVIPYASGLTLSRYRRSKHRVNRPGAIRVRSWEHSHTYDVILNKYNSVYCQ